YTVSRTIAHSLKTRGKATRARRLSFILTSTAWWSHSSFKEERRQLKRNGMVNPLPASASTFTLFLLSFTYSHSAFAQDATSGRIREFGAIRVFIFHSKSNYNE